MFIFSYPFCLGLQYIYLFFFTAENDEVELEVLNILHFDATRKRMSVIVRHPMTRNIILYVKGADSSIFSVLHPKYESEFYY